MAAYQNTSNPNYCSRMYNFQFTKQIYNTIWKHSSNNTKATIFQRLSEESWMISLALSYGLQIEEMKNLFKQKLSIYIRWYKFIDSNPQFST